MKNIPALDPKVLGLVTEISKEPKVEAVDKPPPVGEAVGEIVEGRAAGHRARG